MFARGWIPVEYVRGCHITRAWSGQPRRATRCWLPYCERGLPLKRKPLSSAKGPVNPKSIEIVQRYLAGDLDLESAAHGIHAGGDFGLHYSPETTSAADQERIEALLGRVFWLAMREANPGSVPDRPFGAEEFRAIAKSMSDHERRDRSEEENDQDPNGAA
jgi:hypothetical protein